MKKNFSCMLIFLSLGMSCVVVPVHARRVAGKKFNQAPATRNRLSVYGNVDAEASVLPTEVPADQAAAQPEEPTAEGYLTAEVPAPRFDKISGTDPRAEVTEFFNPADKRKQVIALVEKGSEFLKNNAPDLAFSAFSHSKDFVIGELYLFAYDLDGVCMAHGQQSDLIWKNMINEVDTFGTPIVRSLLEEAQHPKNDGWVTYNWRGATKVSYVREVNNNGQRYMVGSGYYPHSKPDAVVNLVRGAVGFFNDSIEKKRSVANVFSAYSYPLGNFVLGDLYLYALDFDGNIVAQGDRPGLIGTNSLEYKDTHGIYANKEIIERLKLAKPGQGVWIDYTSKNALKKTYAEKITDAKGKNYFLACGYYPKADRREAQNLVKRGYQLMKKSGKTEAARAFNDRRDAEYLYGDLYLMVYDLKGSCIAHGGNTDNVGQNQYNLKDDDGQYYVRNMIGKAEDGGGWLDFKLKNSFFSVYVEPIDLGVEKYVIASGLYPITKRETMMLLIQSGKSYMQSKGPKLAFAEFVKPGGQFIRGDLHLFVFHPTGICLAYGDRYDLIWRNLIDIKDDNGQYFVRAFINTVKQGPGDVTFTLNGAVNTSHVEVVVAGDKEFVIGSGFYK